MKRLPEASEFGKDFSESSTTQRFHRRISLTPDHPIVEYLVEPDASNNLSWHESATLIYKPDLKNSTYEIGTRVDYKNIEPYLLKGWTRWLELRMIWSDGQKAELIFSIENLKPDKDLELDMVAFQVPQVKVDSQQVGVYVNDTEVTTWEADKFVRRYKAVIPHELIQDGRLHLSFTISDTWRFFNDTRWYNVGISLMELTINYAK